MRPIWADIGGFSAQYGSASTAGDFCGNPFILAERNMSPPPTRVKLTAQDHARVSSLKNLSNFEESFNRSFSLLGYIANRFLIDHMLRVGRLLTENDFEMMVIWGVLAHQNVAHLMPPGSVPTAILSERGRLPDDSAIKPLKLRDVADITRIPRETVRRKLERLAVNGHAKRLPCGGWVVIGDRVEPELRDFTRDTIMRLMAVSDEVFNALKHADSTAENGPRKLP
jgi:hypothetical protein